MFSGEVAQSYGEKVSFMFIFPLLRWREEKKGSQTLQLSQAHGLAGHSSELGLDQAGPVSEHMARDSPNAQHCQLWKMVFNFLESSQS